MCDADLDTLQSLVEKSLLRSSDERFWMLETIREYARERLDAAALADDVAGRHARWYRDLSEEYEPELMGPHGARWIVRLEAELANIRSAIEWGIANDSLLAFAIVVNTSYFLNQTGRTREHVRLLDATWLDDVPVELRKRGLRARTGAALEVNDFESMRLLLRATARARSPDRRRRAGERGPEHARDERVPGRRPRRSTALVRAGSRG